jgi:hypothetical protein
MARTAFALAFVMLAATPALAGITPGMWENTSRVTTADMPGMPPQVLEMMRRPHTIRHCVTPEDAAKSPQSMMQDKASKCSVAHFTQTGASYSVEMVCPRMHMTGHGTMTATSYSGTSDITTEGPGGRSMHMTASASGRLVGPCGG